MGYSYELEEKLLAYKHEYLEEQQLNIFCLTWNI